PIFKYFSDLDDFDMRDLKKSAKKAYSKQNPECFSTKSYKKIFEREWMNKSIEDVFALEDHDKAIRLIPWYKFTSEEEVNDLGKYLKSIYPKYFIDGEPIDGVLNSFFRKIVCLYDLLKFNSNW